MELPVQPSGPAGHRRAAVDASKTVPDIRSDDSLEEKVVKVLRTIFDPEIPVNIYDLGLIYGLEVDEAGRVNIRMTLTSPACPVAGSLPGAVESKVRTYTAAPNVNVQLVWDPPWSVERMSEAARLQLGML